MTETRPQPAQLSPVLCVSHQGRQLPHYPQHGERGACPSGAVDIRPDKLHNRPSSPEGPYPAVRQRPPCAGAASPQHGPSTETWTLLQPASPQRPHQAGGRNALGSAPGTRGKALARPGESAAPDTPAPPGGVLTPRRV